MKPLLAHKYAPERITYPCYVQPKLNGVRALYCDGHFQSRDEVPWHPSVLAHIATELQATFPSNFILDGELYVHGWSLQQIMSAITPIRKEGSEDTLKVQYHIFDRVHSTFSFGERYWAMEQFIERPPTTFTLVETNSIANEPIADNFFAHSVTDGYEGIMYRLGECTYTKPKQTVASGFTSDKDNRSWELLKRKNWQDDDYLCIGTTPGEGKYMNVIGALICQTANGSTFNVSLGLTDYERYTYKQQPPIGKVVKVKYLYLSADGIPQNPQILAIYE